MTRWKMSGCIAVLCSMGVFGAASAQQDAGTPPPIMVINREYTKPGRDGGAHEKTEAAFLAAAKAGKVPFHYVAMTSMSGPNRTLFLSGYGSLAGWEEENKVIDKMPAAGAAMDHAMMADGDLLSETDAGVWVRREDQSLNSAGILKARYMQIDHYNVKPGHEEQWNEIVAMVIEGYKKGVPDASWTMYQEVYGPLGTAFAVFMPLKSLSEVDHSFVQDKQFADAMGKDGMKKLSAMLSECVAAEQSNLFRISPKMSLPPDAWVKADPDFWTPKTAAQKKPAQ